MVHLNSRVILQIPKTSNCPCPRWWSVPLFCNKNTAVSLCQQSPWVTNTDIVYLDHTSESDYLSACLSKLGPGPGVGEGIHC